MDFTGCKLCGWILRSILSSHYVQFKSLCNFVSCFEYYLFVFCVLFHYIKRYNIGYVSKTASTSMLTLFESRYTLHWREGTALVMLAKLLLWVCLLSLNQDIHWREGTALVMLAKLLLWVCLLSLNQDPSTCMNDLKKNSFQHRTKEWVIFPGKLTGNTFLEKDRRQNYF